MDRGPEKRDWPGVVTRYGCLPLGDGLWLAVSPGSGSPTISVLWYLLARSALRLICSLRLGHLIEHAILLAVGQKRTATSNDHAVSKEDKSTGAPSARKKKKITYSDSVHLVSHPMWLSRMARNSVTVVSYSSASLQQNKIPCSLTNAASAGRSQ